MIYLRLVTPTKSKRTEYWEAVCEHCGHVFEKIRAKKRDDRPTTHAFRSAAFLDGIRAHIHVDTATGKAKEILDAFGKPPVAPSTQRPRKWLHARCGSDTEYSTYVFEIEVARGRGLPGRRRVFPTGFRSGDEAGAADLATMTAWFKRLGITHVSSTFGNHMTDECCIADGTYTAMEYLAWWSQAEGGDQ